MKPSDQLPLIPPAPRASRKRVIIQSQLPGLKALLDTSLKLLEAQPVVLEEVKLRVPRKVAEFVEANPSAGHKALETALRTLGAGAYTEWFFEGNPPCRGWWKVLPAEKSWWWDGSEWHEDREGPMMDTSPYAWSGLRFPAQHYDYVVPGQRVRLMA